MKKAFLFLAVMLLFASCKHTSTDSATLASDSVSVNVDTVTVAVDTLASDTTK